MLDESNLYIKESNIYNSGLGLFTKTDIENGQIVAEFKGEFLSYGEYVRRLMSGHSKYFIICKSYDMMDSENVECFAKYANDASIDPLDNSDYYEFNERPERPDNNTTIVQCDDNINYLIANRSIKAGEEIYTSYGDSYWNVNKI